MKPKAFTTEQSLLAAIHQAGKLKRIPRMGWRIRGIIPCESVADHAFRVVYIAMLLGDALAAAGKKVNSEKLLRIAILHEIPEALLTDLAKDPCDLLGRAAKHAAESKAMVRLTAGLAREAEYYQLWMEFEKHTSLEGIVVRVADRLEMIAQVAEYEATGRRGLDDFWNNPANFDDFGIPLFKRLWRELKRARKSRG